MILDYFEGHLKTSSARLLRLCVAETKCSELSGTLVYRGNGTIVHGVFSYTEIKQTWIIDSLKPIRSEYSLYPRYNA